MRLCPAAMTGPGAAGSGAAVSEDGDEVSHLDTDTSLARTELSIVAEAFVTLPDRWRVVLRHAVIEAEGPARLCALFGVNAAAVAALAYRACEGLRETYLQAHVRHLVDDACRLYAERLGAYTRGRAGRSQRRRIEDDLAACAGCAKLSAMLRCINSTMARNRAPSTRRRTLIYCVIGAEGPAESAAPSPSSRRMALSTVDSDVTWPSAAISACSRRCPKPSCSAR